ncbi:DUF2325 domain-containing protein [Burkholderia multivorans]|uniref:DUF2325 domain-containing protein n=1 Tax=Burkholderia multivorans TaxID=87883 RepID=UPI001C97CB67|nr:DUF2325 domain-containing protein [Burkholderia multivorans]MBY4673873.1 DUF2325 domain-containing protein [Burkholderia multivorans]
MTATDRNWMQLCDEHGRVIQEYGRAQRRASDVICDQARRIAALETQVMELRAAVMIRETALAWAREELQEVKAAVPGLPKRLALAQQVRVLEARLQALMRGESIETSDGSRPTSAGKAHRTSASPVDSARVVMWISQAELQTRSVELAVAKTGVRVVQAEGADARQLDAGLSEANLVICQVGCVSHDDWWRVKDYCRRTGKRCVLVEQPDALQRVIASAAHVDVDAAD